MGKKTKLGKNRLDKFYHLAKEQGYRSRAAFKLIQLNRKYDFLSNCRALLDLCAAPGGWLQVAAKTMPLTSLIIGVDLVPIKPIRGVKTLVHDITTLACRTALKKEAKGSKFDAVVHDGAPNVGGAWSNEAYTQSALVLDSLRLATEFLAPGGAFVTKVFRSKDYNALLYAFNQLFNKVESTKPTASRNTSAEIFVVCLGYKAPAKIDPRLLDPKHLFQEVADAPKVMGPEALLREKIKQRRHREGYEDGLSTTFKSTSALAFLASATPVEMLGQFSRLALDGADSWQPVEGLEASVKELAEAVRSHPGTTAEIRALCQDLQVLGRSEFKQLLRWRLQLKKALAAELPAEGGKEGGKGSHKKAAKTGADGADAAAGDGAVAADEEAQDPEERLLKEMESVKERMEARQKREKKNRREMKKKAKVRALAMAQSQGTVDGEFDDGLFTLGVIKSGKGQGESALARVADATVLGQDDLEELEAASDSGSGSGSDDSGDSDLDSDEEALRYEAELEEGLEESYKDYLQRRGHREAVVREKRKRLGMDGDLDDDEGGNGDGEGLGPRVGTEDSEDEEAGGSLLVRLDEGRAGVAKTGAAAAKQWFNQDLFDDDDIHDDGDDDEEPAAKPAKKAKHQAPKASRSREGGVDRAAAGSEDSEGEDSEGEPGQRRSSKGAGAAGSGRPSSQSGADFEVVPQSRSGDASGSETDSEDEFDMLDDQGKAEVLALAKKMLRRKEKESIVDAAFCRFSSDDVGLPKWFEDDELRHRRPIMPVTKEEVRAEKERLKSIDTRPIKKVAEAKMRQRKKLHSKLQQAREKAETIANQEDIPNKSKMREIEKLYARARSSANKKKGKGGKSAGGKKRPFDSRLKKDLSDAKRRAKKQGGRKGKAGGKGGGRKGGK